MILSLAVLSTALLFGGMTFYSFGFAAFLFKALPARAAGQALRLAFPWFYAFVIGTAAVAAMLWWSQNTVFAALMATVALTTVPVRQYLMPAINRATDDGMRERFKWLHGLSVVVTLGHIAATGWLLANLTVLHHAKDSSHKASVAAISSAGALGQTQGCGRTSQARWDPRNPATMRLTGPHFT